MTNEQIATAIEHDIVKSADKTTNVIREAILQTVKIKDKQIKQILNLLKDDVYGGIKWAKIADLLGKPHYKELMEWLNS